MAATPICRCRVLYLGSAVPHASKDGLQGIQGPLRELYPEGGARGARGIDSWLSVWSNGLLLENVDEHRQEVTRFFPISSLHYCAAVRHVLVPERGVGNGPSPGGGGAQPRFLPLDSPFAAAPSTVHPPLFAAILRRTTGIKVLECHVFICKREAAANALVRCCFHAYADSSYAKHIDGGGENGSPESIYGTLRGEGWRRASTTSLSNGHHQNGTIDFDSNDGEVDDASVYNGDENHKVWAGREDEDKDNGGGIYGYGGSSAGTTLRSRGRNARPRQVTEPVPPPPPPPPTSSTPTKSDKKERTKMREMYPPRQGRPRSAMSLGMHQIHHPMPMAIPPHPGVMMTLPPPGRMFVPMAGPPIRRGPPGPPNPRFMFAPPPPPPPPPHFVATLGRRRIAAEEPVYMPSARPLSPVASYQPGHFPHDAYLMQHYATATLDGRGKKKNKKAKKNGMPMPVPIPVLIPPPPPSQLNGAALPAASPDNHHDSSGENSPSGTGIYRKKGHLNERAFSYSIRQEHRSRSHGSLASLKFAAPTNSATGTATGPSADHKKEREIVHMMRGLDLMGDDLERSEVPPAVLNAAKQNNSRTLR